MRENHLFCIGSPVSSVFPFFFAPQIAFFVAALLFFIDSYMLFRNVTLNKPRNEAQQQGSG